MFGFFKDKIENFKQTISNTTQNLIGNVLSNVDTSDEEYSEFALDDIEDTLISADLGVDYSAELVDNLHEEMADVYVTLRELRKITDIVDNEKIGDTIDYKRKRMAKRLGVKADSFIF
jgi:signal recognition particle GTPase